MKIYPNILAGIAECLKNIFLYNKYTGDVLDKAFRNNKKWGSRDRRFIGEAVFEIVRWQRLLSYAANTTTSESDYFEKIIAVYLLKSDCQLPEFFSQLNLDPDLIIGRLNSTDLPFPIKESIPDWLNELGKKELSADWEKEVSALNSPASVYLRVNTLKTTISDLHEKLKSLEIETSLNPALPDCLILHKRQVLSSLQEYKDGLFEIQDAGSQQIAPFLNIETGMKIIDACAGAGGKTLHIASLLKNTGQIISMDVEEKKLIILKERALRAGAKNIGIKEIQPENIEKLKNFADRLLLDVPCSGLGVLKRNPDAKWKLSKSEIDKTVLLQAKILAEYTSMLKPEGILVYATCSILPAENEKQIEMLIKKSKKAFELEDQRHVWPSEGADGFYMARLKKII